MLTVSRLRRKPRHFHRFTGLTPAEFDSLLAEVTPAYEGTEQQKSTTRSGHPNRHRKAGAGRPFVLPLPERLLMGLVYLRLYTGQSILSFLFDVDQSTVCRELSKRLLPILLTVLPVPLRDAPLRAQKPSEPESIENLPGQTGQTGPKRRRINTLDELLRTYPELSEVLLDATEQSMPQPEDKRKRKLAYSGKKHDHTIKTQILSTKELILHVFGGLPGCLHDVTLLGASGVLHQVPEGVRVRLDKAYTGEGVAKRYPNVQLEQPIKKKRGFVLTAFGRAYNHLLSVLRIPVEHHFARLQTFGILAGEFRGRWESHEDIFCIVSGLLNFRKTGRFTLENA